MASRTLRRRLHHGDVDGRRHEHLETSEMDSLNEPLLGNRNHDNDEIPQESTLADLMDGGRSRETMHWSMLFSHLIAQWAQWLANIVLGSGSLIGRLLPFISPFQDGAIQKNLPPSLSSLQEARLKHLKLRLAVPFDGTCLQHQDALKQLWRLAYPDKELPPLKSEMWKEMGWQGSDPSTDFRGGGFISLENLIFFAKTYPVVFHDLLHKRYGNRSQWEYPFAVAGINISFMLVQMLDLQSDAQWLARRASYMEFNDVLKSARTQLERELVLEDVTSIRDLPAYNLLKCK